MKINRPLNRPFLRNTLDAPACRFRSLKALAGGAILGLAPMTGSAQPEAVQPGAGSGEAVDSGDLQQQLRQTQNQMQVTHARLFEIQQQASTDSDVQEAFDRYRAVVSEKIKGSFPASAEKLDRMQQLLTRLRDVGDPRSLPEDERQDLIKASEEFQNLREEIAPLEQQVQSLPEVQQAKQEHELILSRKMLEIDGDTGEIMQQQEALRSRYDQLQQQLIDTQSTNAP